MLIVLDQFEQWLHAQREEENTELVQALRQCDGGHVQCIVMVRDDFWMAATRFMRELEVRLVEGQNSAAVDLFDPSHAGKVLAAFGRAFGKLPGSSADRSKDQEHFLKEAVAGLAQDGKVVCVRLALFAEMMKGKPWTPATLKRGRGQQGGRVHVSGGDASAAATAPAAIAITSRPPGPSCRPCLPESGTDIKGHMRSYAELLEASGYCRPPQDFDDLIRILDAELRLITPTDPRGRHPLRGGSRRTRRGCTPAHARLPCTFAARLADPQAARNAPGPGRAAAGGTVAVVVVPPENRFLPSMWEWANIRLLTRSRGWTEDQRRMMRHAGRMHGMIALAALLLIALGIVGVVEARGSLRASGLVGSLRTAATSEVPSIIRQLEGLRRWADPELKRMLRESALASREHLHASMVLLEDDSSQLGYLTDRLLSASTTELPVLQELLQPHQATLVPQLWTVLDAAQPGDTALLAAGSSLARYAADDPRWPEHGRKIAEVLVRSPLFLGAWRSCFARSGRARGPPCRHPSRPPTQPQGERARARRDPSRGLHQRSARCPGRPPDGRRPGPVRHALPGRPLPARDGRAALLAELSKEPGPEPPAGTGTADELIAARRGPARHSSGWTRLAKSSRGFAIRPIPASVAC